MDAESKNRLSKIFSMMDDDIVAEAAVALAEEIGMGKAMGIVRGIAGKHRDTDDMGKRVEICIEPENILDFDSHHDLDSLEPSVGSILDQLHWEFGTDLVFLEACGDTGMTASFISELADTVEEYGRSLGKNNGSYLEAARMIRDFGDLAHPIDLFGE